MTVHCVKASGSQYKIQTRSLSCFCSHCLYGEGDGCTNKDTVGAWANVQLKPKTVVQRQRVASPEETDLDDPVDDSMYVVPGEMVASPEGTGLDDPADDSMSAVPREIVASPEDFVAVVLSDSRGRGKPVTYIAKVLQVDKGDVKLRFLKPSAAKDIYTWPQHNDISWQPQSDITMKLTPPQLVPGRGIKLRFSHADMTQLFTK